MNLPTVIEYLRQRRGLSLLLTFGLGFVPVLGSLGVIWPIFLTLVDGPIIGGMFTVVGVLPYVMGILYHPSHDGFGVLEVASIGIVIIASLLTFLMACFLHIKVEWSKIIQAAVLIGALVVSVVHLVYPDIAFWWEAQLKLMTTATWTKSSTIVPLNAGTQAAQLEFIRFTRAIATGAVLAAILFSVIFNLIMARWLQAVVENKHLVRQDWVKFKLNPLAGVLFVLSVICVYFGNTVVIDIMPVLLLLFMVVGLTILHVIVSIMMARARLRIPARVFWRILMYIIIIYTLPYSGVILTAVALGDIWFDFREHITHRMH